MSMLSVLSRLTGLFGGNQSAPGIPFSNRNVIVDGNMDNWISNSVTLAASATSGGLGTMFPIAQGAGGAATVTKGIWTLGAEPNGMAAPTANVLQWQQTTACTGSVAAGTAPFVAQHVESVRNFQGRSATFSCWLWVSSGTQQITNIVARQSFGTSGSPSATVIIDTPVNWTLTTTPQRFSVRVDFPSITGKTLGTAGNDFINIGVWLPVGTTYTLSTAQWQLEAASPDDPATGNPTAFEYRGQAAEAARVNRYYQNVSQTYTVGNTNYQQMSFICPMLQTPGQTYSASSGTVTAGGASTTGAYFAMSYTSAYNTTVTGTFDARL